MYIFIPPSLNFYIIDDFVLYHCLVILHLNFSPLIGFNAIKTNLSNVMYLKRALHITGILLQDAKKRTPRRGHQEEDAKKRTPRRGHQEEDAKKRTPRRGRQEEDAKKRTPRRGRHETAMITRRYGRRGRYEFDKKMQ